MEAKKGRRRGGVKRGGKGDFNRREVDQAYKSLGEVFDSKLGGAEKEEIEAKAFSSAALWSRSTKNPDCSTGSLARPFARSLVHLLCTASFARALRYAHSFDRSLPLLTSSLVGK